MSGALRRAALRFLHVFRPDPAERELAREVDAHLAMLADQFERQGMTAADARVAARRAFGGVERAEDEHRDVRSFVWLADWRSDIRYSVRRLLANPAFTTIAVVTLAVGIGVNAIVFTVTNAVLFRGFPLVERNDRIVYMTSGRGCCVSYPDFLDWRAQAQSFVGMELVHGVPATLTDGSGFPERIELTEVTAGTFSLAGQKPILGRDFTDADEALGGSRVAIVRYGLWQRRFGADPEILGRVIRLNGVPFTVIGVMPRGFSFPQNQDVWVPLVPTPEVLRRDVRNTWFVFGRLRDEVSVEQARAEMDTIGRRLGAAYPQTNGGRNLVPFVEDFEAFFIGANAGLVYRALWVAVGVVLLIAVMNLANLLLARAMSRSREISVRMAIGAGRWRIVRQLLIESVVLSSLGGVAGWLIARWGVRVYAPAANGSGVSDQTLGGWFNDVLDYSMDSRVFVYLAAMSIGTGVLFGLVPALRLSRLDVNSALKEGGRHAAGEAGTRRLAGILVTVEVALAVVLLAGAGVMLRSFLNLVHTDHGFDPDCILTARIEPTSLRYPDGAAQMTFYDRLSAGLRTVSGLESHALSSLLPGETVGVAGRRSYELAGAAPVDAERRPTVTAQRLSEGYFATLGLRLRAGREFQDADGPRSMPVAIVNERFVAVHWPGARAVGQRLRLFRGPVAGPWLTVIGVAPDIGGAGASNEVEPIIYLSYRQQPPGQMWVLMRAAASPDVLVPEFRRQLQTVDAELPIMTGPMSLAELLASSHQYRAVMATLSLVFAAIALLLAAVGLYGLMAQAVSDRTQEIGVRQAIGADTREIVRLVLGQGMRSAVLGLAIGLIGWFAVSRVLRPSLIDVSPNDPLTLGCVALVLMLSASLGCLVPARRALRVDPVTALRPR